MSDEPGDGGVTNQPDSGATPLTSLTRAPAVTESLDTTFDILRDARRRYLLYYLFGLDEDVAEFEAAVNAVCLHEAADTRTDDTVHRESVSTSLRHKHLPRLADAEILDFDRRHGTIRFTATPALEEWVEHARHKETE